jgi:hypothetical protein
MKGKEIYTRMSRFKVKKKTSMQLAFQTQRHGISNTIEKLTKYNNQINQ